MGALLRASDRKGLVMEAWMKRYFGSWEVFLFLLVGALLLLVVLNERHIGALDAYCKLTGHGGSYYSENIGDWTCR